MPAAARADGYEVSGPRQQHHDCDEAGARLRCDGGTAMYVSVLKLSRRGRTDTPKHIFLISAVAEKGIAPPPLASRHVDTVGSGPSATLTSA